MHTLDIYIPHPLVHIYVPSTYRAINSPNSHALHKLLVVAPIQESIYMYKVKVPNGFASRSAHGPDICLDRRYRRAKLSTIASLKTSEPGMKNWDFVLVYLHHNFDHLLLWMSD